MCHSRPIMNASRIIASCLLALPAGAVFAQTSDTKPPAEPPPFYVEAADCTAAFEANVKTRLTQAKTPARDEAILKDTEKGFIFVGVAYKQGLRNPEADKLLHEAEQRWQKLSKEEQAKRLSTCSAKAGDLMDEVSFIERYIVRNRAQSRVDKLLSKEKPS